MDQVARMCNDAPAPRIGRRTTGRTAPAAVRAVAPRNRLRLLAAPLLALLAVLLVATPARAHDVLVASDPKDGAVLGAMPAAVTLTFNQVVRRDYARIAVTGPDGAHYEQGEVRVDGPRVSIGVRTGTPAGAYVIGYRIVSNDGHPVTGTVKFSVTGAGAAPGTPSQPTDPPAAGATTGSGASSGQGGGSWVWGLLAVTAALLALCARVLVKHDRRLREGTVPAPSSPPAPPATDTTAGTTADTTADTAAGPTRAASPASTAGGTKTSGTATGGTA
ncbi:copper resistance CopC family protein [Microbispora sp. NPDC049633]|uniref:copper resistance CopC family protein n=1 Tax=Microbispora sp. NPDC049633 TaxID=3154355 RepID=UPI00342CEBC4